MFHRPVIAFMAMCLGHCAFPQDGTVYKIGGVYFSNCATLVGSGPAALLNVGPWRGAETDVDMDVLDEYGSLAARVHNGRLIQGDTARYRIKRDKITFAVWDAMSGRVICLLRPAPPDHGGNLVQVEVSLDTYTVNARWMHCDPEHSDLPAMEQVRSNTIIGKQVCLELE